MMTEEEKIKLVDRVNKYNVAKDTIQKLDKVAITLEAIADGEEHEIDSIVIDVRRNRIRYMTTDNNRQLEICSFAQVDQEELVKAFIAFSTDQVMQRINVAESEMNEA